MKWFEHIKRGIIDDIVKKLSEIRVVENWGRGRPKMKEIGVIGEDMRAFGVKKNMVRDKDRLRERI